ncbi:protein of unknown function [Methylocaldum szegediense]|uniref:Uncharacterized protein n=1 Tax=Methylocaldum szegediense TaxID=73780 RepID=A0ABM9I8U2_9GAMM|nr:protein of unknown function [Methylocaldum szegediense]
MASNSAERKNVWLKRGEHFFFFFFVTVSFGEWTRTGRQPSSNLCATRQRMCVKACFYEEKLPKIRNRCRFSILERMLLTGQNHTVCKERYKPSARLETEYQPFEQREISDFGVSVQRLVEWNEDCYSLGVTRVAARAHAGHSRNRFTHRGVAYADRCRYRKGRRQPAGVHRRQ